MTELEAIKQATNSLNDWVNSDEMAYLDISATIKYAVNNYDNNQLVIDVVKDKVSEFFINGVTPDGDELTDVDWAEFIACVLLE